MRKETVLKLLSNICLLIPGNIKSRKGWYLSLYTLISLIGLAIVIYNFTIEVIGYKAYAEDRKTNEMLQNFTHPPNRLVAYCLKRPPLRNSVEFGTGPNNETVPAPSQSKGNGMGKAPPPPPPPTDSNYLEDIVGTFDRLLAFAVNVSARLFLWFSFPNMIDLFLKLFDSTQQPQEYISGQKGSFMVQLWRESVQIWSPCQKIFILTIALSLLQRELDIYFQFHWSLQQIGMDLIDIPCILFQIVAGQVRTLTSRELVMEVATFFLLILMETFVNMLKLVAERDDMEQKDPINSLNTGKQSKMMTKSDNLFLRTRGMLLTSELNMGDRAKFQYPNKIASIHEHISEVVGGSGQDFDDANHESSLIFKMSHRKQLSPKFPNPGDEKDAGKDIYSKINFIISMYFELMATWEQCSKITGFTALLLFAELTSTFCFNTYLTLDSAMTFGLFSGIGIGGILRGIVIITKFVCVCNTAQTLKDMTPVLLDRILKLKLNLLSLPVETHAERNFADLENEGVYANPSNEMQKGCERCRGLGSFLSEMVSYIRGHPFELSALGYFTVCRSTLTTITGVIVTYLVVLVQFQSYASTKSS